MKKKLKQLFDYQKFENNEKLRGFIAEADCYRAETLTDAQMGVVNAAGDPQETQNEFYGIENEHKELDEGSRLDKNWYK